MKELKSINRRDFIRYTGGLLSTSLVTLPTFAQASAKKYKMGLQLFTVRDALARDLTGTIKQITAIGYEDTETYGYNPERGKYYGLPASEFKLLLTDNQLITTSGHYDFHRYFEKPADDLRRYVDQCITGAKVLGQRYITWPWIDQNSRTLEKFKQLAQQLNFVGEQVNKAGLGFAYHNHDYEFFDLGGQTGYDIVMRETDPSLVKLQLDLYWAKHSAKLSPAELISKQPGRFVMWHVKDMHKVSRDYTELGNGSIDYTVILPEASRAGLQFYYIEQGGNFAKDSMTSIADSAAFFKKNLERYLL
jgi:sugar phosphate isomerase/epimerase